MKKTNKNTIINTASVKVQFMTSSKDFTATMSKFWVAINEMADKKLILQNNLRISAEWAELKKDDAQAQSAYLADVEKYQKEYDAFKEDYNNRVVSCYELMTDKLYEGYTTSEDAFKEAMTEWFKGQNIEPTSTLISFMSIAVGYKNSSNKQLYKTGNTLSYKAKTTFKNSFMRALCQLMKDKNALKTDAYKYTYVEPDKKKSK
jgi:C-terminal processing protease CtpA/Prc